MPTQSSLIPEAITVFLTCESEEELVSAPARASHRVGRQPCNSAWRPPIEEMARIPDFDYVVVNRRDALDAAVDDVVAIIRAEHCRSRTQ